MPKDLRNIVSGREGFPPAHVIPRHRHDRAYAIVTLKGSMHQVSYGGRVSTRPGQLLVQPTFDCHANQSCLSGVQILRLPWRREAGLGGLFEIADIDYIVRMAERDPLAASEQAFDLVQKSQSLPPKRDDWEDLLAADLARDSFCCLGNWARQSGLARETLSRGFARRFHCTPARFRFEIKAREAWLRLTSTNEPFAMIAAESGFADQAHMTRAIRSITGRVPSFWRERGAADGHETGRHH